MFKEDTSRRAIILPFSFTTLAANAYSAAVRQRKKAVYYIVVVSVNRFVARQKQRVVYILDLRKICVLRRNGKTRFRQISSLPEINGSDRRSRAKSELIKSVGKLDQSAAPFFGDNILSKSYKYIMPQSPRYEDKYSKSQI